MRNLLLPACTSALLCIIAFFSVAATEHEAQETAQEEQAEHEEARVRHYAFDIPENKIAALELYYMNMGIIAHVLENTELTEAQLESIHERTYALEAAEKFFHTHDAYDKEKLTSLKHLIHELHEESEEHQPVETRNYYAELAASDDFLLQ